MFDRHQERLAQLRERVLVVEFAGAAGTLASLGTAQGNKGFEVQAALADELGLGVPATTWHVARDGFAEAVNLLAYLAATGARPTCCRGRSGRRARAEHPSGGHCTELHGRATSDR